MSDERKISQLIEEADLNIGTGNHKEAEHRLFQARALNTLSIMRQLSSENSIHESASERRVG